MVDLHRLAGFHLVATEGGYAKAARAASYPITQPALHQQVRKLEAEIGTTLLERVGKDRMQPTPAGQHLLQFLSPFFRDLPCVINSVRTADFDGSLTIHAESLLIRQLLPGWLMNLRKKRAKAQLHLQELIHVDINLLRSGSADVLIAHIPDVPDDIASQEIATVHACLVVPRERAKKRGRPKLDELTDMPFLSYPVGSRQYALQLPAFVIMDLLDVPRDMLDEFKEWSDDMAVFIGGARNAGDKYQRAARGCQKMSSYFARLIKDRTENASLSNALA